MKRDVYDGFGLITGTREDIEEVVKSLFKEEAKAKALTNLPEGKYTFLELDEWWDVNCTELMETFPACELLIYHGAGKHGSCMYCISDAGKAYSQEDFFYVHSNGDLECDKNIKMIFEGKIVNTYVIVKLKDGEELRYMPSDKSIKMLDLLISKPLTLGLISDVCNPYTVARKRTEFIDSVKKQISDINNVSSIEFVERTESLFTENDIEELKQTEIASNLPDTTVLRFLNSSHIETVKKNFNYTVNTVTTRRESIISAMEDPAQGKYNLVLTEYRKPVEKVEQLAGTATADFVDMKYEESGKSACICTKCISDFEVIRVPDKIDGLAVAGISEGCFEKLTNVKKVILPTTVKSIGNGAFSGCKKLAAVVYADNTDSKDDFVICEKGKLITLFTNKSSYVIPDIVSEIGKNAFSNCIKLKELTIRPGMKRLINDSLAGCKTLKKVNLTGNFDDINITALEKGDIKEVVLPDGRIITVHDKALFSCFENTDKGLQFSYQAASEKLPIAGSEGTKFKLAIDLLDNHIQEIDDNAATSVLEFAIKYAIGKEDAETLGKLLESDYTSKIDFTEMIQQTNRCGKLEIATMLLTKSGQSEGPKKIIIRNETPAETIGGWEKLYIKVRFENNKAYSYFCGFKVKEGDKVFVPGKMAGMPGEVIEILKDFPSGTAARYTLEVTEAYNVCLEESSDSFEL